MRTEWIRSAISGCRNGGSAARQSLGLESAFKFLEPHTKQVSRGELNSCLIAGSEALCTFMRAMKQGYETGAPTLEFRPLAS